ncbi:DUF4304 domain-containing protein [Geodermatophilus nigrescens]|uniref:DUF4304 domain-containing protein n=1 Tax=Geodermatophilus nigrescens TaxID=1070870 RepID=UPI0009333767|nr:DUF4304 domain-containing protein [Geodermatophilus nigrescens]
MPDLESHRAAVDRALSAAGVTWEAWPQAAVEHLADPQDRLSALLMLLAPSATVSPGDEAAAGDRSREVIDRLRRRRLPWTAATAGLALRVVRQRGEFDHVRVPTALRAAERVAVSGAADVALLDELQRCRSWLTGIPHDWQVPQTRSLADRVLAALAPPDMLDLSLLHDGDCWGAAARECVRAHDPSAVTALVRRLGELGAGAPSATWLRRVQDALEASAARDLLRDWLRLAADSDVIARDGQHRSSGGRLFAPGNEDMVRAAVVATRLLPEEQWVPELLGVLARRGAASSGAPGVTEALCLKVAGAAVDSLAARGTPADREVLGQLLVDLSRRDLVKRIGVALGAEAQAADRDTRLRREKAAAVRRRADPAPRQARAEVDALLRRHLAATLRRHGFRGSGRTWRRLHDDRVDVVSPGSSGDELAVAYGTRFDAAHPESEPHPVERAALRDHHLDIRLIEYWGTSGSDLDRLARHLDVVVVPFLDTLGRYELTRSFLEHRSGAPAPGWELEVVEPHGPAAEGLLGLLALAASDRATAIDRLTRRLAFEDSPGRGDGDHAEAARRFWRGQLAHAQALPSGDD